MLKHAKNNLNADGPDPSLVQPSDWNADHVFTGDVTLPGNLLVNNKLWFVGTTAATPMLKQSGTELQVRLGDDSLYTNFRASSFIAAGGGNFYGASGSFFQSSVDGVWRLSNTAANDFGRLQFGGVTNAFPALKRLGAVLQVRLADDSAPGNIEAATGTFFGPLQAGTHNLYDIGAAITRWRKTWAVDGEFSGLVGIGVTPNPAWTYKALQIGPVASLYTTGTGAVLASNNYYDAGGNKYLQAGAGALLLVDDATGVLGFYNAPVGAANAAASYTQRMAVDAAGNLSITGNLTTAAGAMPTFGTWSPNFVGATGGTVVGTANGTYARTPGGYTAWFDFAATNHNMTGNLTLTGLPFTQTGNALGSLVIADIGGWNGATGGYWMLGRVIGTGVNMFLMGTNIVGTTYMNSQNFNPGFTVRGSIFVPMAT